MREQIEAIARELLDAQWFGPGENKRIATRLAAIAQGVGEGGNTGTVADIPDAALVARALAHAIRRRRKREPAWATVSNVFALGSTYAAQLCRRFNRDPETGAAIAPQQDTGGEG